MSDNPFKIIRSTDLPPEHLRSEVIGRVQRLTIFDAPLAE